MRQAKKPHLILNSSVNDVLLLLNVDGFGVCSTLVRSQLIAFSARSAVTAAPTLLEPL